MFSTFLRAIDIMESKSKISLSRFWKRTKLASKKDITFTLNPFKYSTRNTTNMKIGYLQILHYIGEFIGIILILGGFILIFYEPAQTYRPFEIILFLIGTILLGIGIFSQIILKRIG
jgi:hypothetical protein